MKKRYLLSLLIVSIALAAGWALAEKAVDYDRPSDPNLMAVRAAGRLASQLASQQSRSPLETIRMYLSGDPVVTDSCVTQSGDYYSGRTWTVTPTGGSGEYVFRFYIGEQNSTFGNSNVCYFMDYDSIKTDSGEIIYQYTESHDMTFQFLVPGNYYFMCIVKDSSGAETRYSKRFSVPADGHATLDEHVNGIVAQCRAAGCTSDFDTALWLHDWLTNNIYYDYSYSYYGADSALLRGTCVCDGYSKAYYLLLIAAGMSVDRALSNDHAWNVVMLNGKWYNIDPTWDDPGSATTAVSGSEHHFYFGLPDDVTAWDHGSYSSPQSCTAFDENYFIHTGRVSMWVETLRDDVIARLNDSMWASILGIPDTYPIEKEGYHSQGKEHIVYAVAARQMSGSEWSVNGDSLRLNVTYRPSEKKLHVRVKVEDSLLTLPAGLAVVEAESFYDDDSIMGVALPDGATTIGANAFSECDRLWAVYIPDSVNFIDLTAFSNSPRVNILCHADSAAEDFADTNHINKAVIEGAWGSWN